MRIHFVGILGASMSGLAKLCSSFGDVVTGSDRNLNGHDKNNVENADVVVYTNAVGENNVEVVYAREIGKRVIERAEFLGEILMRYETVFAISGTHGKTSTAGFLASIFQPYSPTLHIGGQLANDFEIVGGDEYIICEACEYRNSFHFVKSNIALILNMEFDHPDFFEGENDYAASFQKFAKGAKKIIVHEDIANYFGKWKQDNFCLKSSFVTFGLSENADYFVKKIRAAQDGVTFNIFHNRKMLLKNAKIRQFGLHSVLNALASVALSHEAGANKKEIKEGLYNFKGVKRRQESVGSFNDAFVYTDYAHHPSEVNSILKTFNNIKSKGAKLHVVYEPHTYSRTKTFLRDYALALNEADEIVLTNIFAAREINTDNLTSQSLAGEVTKCSDKPAYYFEDEDFILEYLKKTVQSGDIVLFCGAGNIDKLAKRFIK
ncbi:MAG: UDP-N-acetylmuramate--L-alanine ligase [Firmicutes bacterium]|nr:UDP-N-acetylmuramate--L-alanine ligase [Bacillota bacterium]